MKTRNTVSPRASVALIEHALKLTKDAARALEGAGAHQARRYVRRAQKSVEGALRHADRRAHVEERDGIGSATHGKHEIASPPDCCGVYVPNAIETNPDCDSCGWPEAAHALVLT